MEAASAKDFGLPWAMSSPPTTSSSRKVMAEQIIFAACSRVSRALVSARRWPFTSAPSVIP